PLSSRAVYRHSVFPSKPPPPTVLYTLSLHDALPISAAQCHAPVRWFSGTQWRSASARTPWSSLCRRFAENPHRYGLCRYRQWQTDRKSTRLNSSHVKISYAVFCLKKKKTQKQNTSHN